MKELCKKYILKLHFLYKHQIILMQWVNYTKYQNLANKWMATYNKHIQVMCQCG